MQKAVIYYRQKKNENEDSSIRNLKKIVKHLESITYKIYGVYIDIHEDQHQLNELLNSPLKEIDILYTNHSFDDDFDNQLIKQLSKAEGFIVKYLDDL